MEPVVGVNSSTIDTLEAIERKKTMSCFEFSKKACIYLPFPLLGCTAIGGLGFGFWTAFGTGALKAASIANIAFDGLVVGASIFSCGCYYKNLPEKSFEDNVKRQGSANIELQGIEIQVNQTISQLKNANNELDVNLVGMDEKIKALENALELKTVDLLKLADELRETVLELNKTKENFEIAQKTVDDAKMLVVSMTNLSVKMKSTVNASKIAINLFKEESEDFGEEIKGLDLSNENLKNLLENFSKIVVKEHEQFKILMQTCDRLDVTCQKLEMQISELSKTETQISSEVERGIQNTKNLERIEKELAELSEDLDI